jgi:hypothetical protein
VPRLIDKGTRRKTTWPPNGPTTLGSDKKLQKGAKVKIYKYEGEKFIKTKADGIKKDNLDKLPIF